MSEKRPAPQDEQDGEDTLQEQVEDAVGVEMDGSEDEPRAGQRLAPEDMPG